MAQAYSPGCGDWLCSHNAVPIPGVASREGPALQLLALCAVKLWLGHTERIFTTEAPPLQLLVWCPGCSSGQGALSSDQQRLSAPSGQNSLNALSDWDIWVWEGAGKLPRLNMKLVCVPQPCSLHHYQFCGGVKTMVLT